MEDGKTRAYSTEDCINTFQNLNVDKTSPPNGHDHGEHSKDSSYSYKCEIKTSLGEDSKKVINPLKICIGKRLRSPDGDSSAQEYFCEIKRRVVSEAIKENEKQKKKTLCNPTQLHKIKTARQITNTDVKKIKKNPMKLNRNGYSLKKLPIEKGSQLNEYAQYLGLQPTVKFKCRKCCSISFKTLALLKEHQRMCRGEHDPGSQSDCTPGRTTRKVYLCSACGTYYENWNLFLHMREVHNRHICLFCLGMFSKADKLTLHLNSKHKVQEGNYSSPQQFFSVYSGSLYLMCCFCNFICTESDNFFTHNCQALNTNENKDSSLYNSTISKSNNETSERSNVDKIIENISEGVNERNKFDSGSHISQIQIVSNKPTHEENLSETIVDIQKSINTSHTPLDLSKMVSNKEDNSINRTNSDYDLLENISMQNNSELNDLICENKNDSLLTLTEEKTKSESNVEPDPQINSPQPKSSIENLSKDHSVKRTDTFENLTVNNNLCVEKVKEPALKLTFSLNSSKSPVIVNSTVGPVPKPQSGLKPPNRQRRPPRRYDDSPTTPTSLLAPGSMLKTTIYDLNPTPDTINRVPKLTVRVPREILEKQYSSSSESDEDRLNLDVITKEPDAEENLDSKKEIKSESPNLSEPPQYSTDIITNNECNDDKTFVGNDITETIDHTKPEETLDIVEDNSDATNINEETPPVELKLDRPLDKYLMKDLLKVFVNAMIWNCVYCNHVRKIAVNCKSLSLHILEQHRFSATVDSITAEELLPDKINAKIKSSLNEVESVFINTGCYDSIEKNDFEEFDQTYECFQCYFKSSTQKELYFHNRKLHQKTILLCIMCKSNFYSYSELLCHMCPGLYNSEHEMKFRCCFCKVDNIPSTFRLMIHLRKSHHSCEICLEKCQNQSRLSNHVWKHKLHHLCYRCGIAYRNKPDITKHLFWKHGTESILCKKCLQKKWPHVYHFCVPPNAFICEECNLTFSKAVYLKVHKRIHSSDFPYICSEKDCEEKFVSKKLLDKHSLIHIVPESIDTPVKEENPEIFLDERAKIKEVVNVEIEAPIVETEKIEVAVEEPKLNPTLQLSKKAKKHRNKDKESLLLDVNLPALNLSESDSSDDESNKPESDQIIVKAKLEEKPISPIKESEQKVESNEEPELTEEESKKAEAQVLDIWNNFKQYQAKVERQKTPPLVPIRKHVCESDHDYCLIPTDINVGDNDFFTPNKKQKRKHKQDKKDSIASLSSSSSSDSDSSCSCGSNCSCSSSGSSSCSSSSESESSENEGKIKSRSHRRDSQNSAVDVTAMVDTPVLVPEETKEPPIPETDLETDETDTDEDFYDEHPQKSANKMFAEKRNKLMMLASVAPSDSNDRNKNELMSEDKQMVVDANINSGLQEVETRNKKKSKAKKRKKMRSTKKQKPIKLNIPKDKIVKPPTLNKPLPANKITISLQSNTVHLGEGSEIQSNTIQNSKLENTRASKRRRVPNKFYGYSSDDELMSKPAFIPPYMPPKLEWRKEDLPTPTSISKPLPQPSFIEPPIRLTTPVVDPVPPQMLLNSDSPESSDSDSSNERALQIVQPSIPPVLSSKPVLNKTHGMGLPYPFPRPQGIREAREGESVYCYCRCPYDEVSEMIGCDAPGCSIEWFHFECVGIMVPPKGKWYCPDCRIRLGMIPTM